jgi:hypothetical protein
MALLSWNKFKIAAGHMLKVLSSNPKMVTGVVNMICPDGSQPAPTGFTGDKAFKVPRGLNIDGNDDVWIGNFWGRGVVLMAGDGTKGHPAGTKTGDAIHVFQGGSIQMLTDVSIDPAGNVWAANNWNSLNGAASPDPLRLGRTHVKESSFFVSAIAAAGIVAELPVLVVKLMTFSCCERECIVGATSRTRTDCRVLEFFTGALEGRSINQGDKYYVMTA